MRGYMFQSMALVIIERRFNLGLLQRARDTAPDTAAALDGHQTDLALLLEAVRDPENAPQLEAFIDSTKGTNVGRAKAVRFLYLWGAL